MRHSSRALLTVLALSAMACDRALRVDAPEPPHSGEPAPQLAPLPLSIVDAPIAYDLGAALAEYEAAVPRVFGDLEERRAVRGNARAHYAWAAERAPFTVRADGATITLATTLAYEGRGWYDAPLLPEVSASCGTGDERPRVRVAVQSVLALDTAWRLVSASRLATLAPLTEGDRDRCRVTALRIDVTDRVLGAVRPQLRRQLRALDTALGRIDIARRLDGVWQKLAAPIRLADSLWLTIDPQAVYLGDITDVDGRLVADLVLTARPRLRTGIEPPAATATVPHLPPLRPGVLEGDALQAVVEARVRYDVLSAKLTESVQSREVSVAGRALRVTRIDVRPLGGGRVALGATLRGAARGRIWFTGTPSWDTLTKQLSIPDLEFDVGSANLLVAGLAFLRGVELRDVLRERARYPAEDVIGGLAETTARAMNRELTDGVILESTLDALDVLDVQAQDSAIIVRGRASGTMRLSIDRAPPVPRAVRQFGR